MPFATDLSESPASYGRGGFRSGPQYRHKNTGGRPARFRQACPQAYFFFAAGFFAAGFFAAGLVAFAAGFFADAAAFGAAAFLAAGFAAAFFAGTFFAAGFLLTAFLADFLATFLAGAKSLLSAW